MIELKIGNIVKEVKEGIILHQVNAQGVMKSGVAKDIREAYPIVFEKYAEIVGAPYTQKDNGLHLLGQIIPVKVAKNLYVVNMIGQQFFGRSEGHRYTSYDALDRCLASVRTFALEDGWVHEEYKVAETCDHDEIYMPNGYVHRMAIHFPLIGCGLGGGSWKVVQSIIEKNLAGLRQNLWVLPGFDPEMLES